MGFALLEHMWEMAALQARGGLRLPGPQSRQPRACRGAGACCEDGAAAGLRYCTNVYKPLVPFKNEMSGEEIPLLNSSYHCYLGRLGWGITPDKGRPMQVPWAEAVSASKSSGGGGPARLDH